MFKKPDIAPLHLPPEKAQAEGIVAAMNSMHYSAAGVAAEDLAAGVDFLRDMQKAASFSWLSVNLQDTKRGKPLFLPHILHQVGDITIGVIGLTGPLKKNQNSDLLANISVLPWVDTLPKLINGIKEQVDMIILLSSYPESVNKVIAKRFKDIHLIIESGGKAGNKEPELINNTLLCRTMERGKYLGVLRIDWKKSATWGKNIDKKIKELRNKLDRVLWLLGRLEKEKAGQDLSGNKRYQTLLQERKELNEEIERLQASVKTESAEAPSTYSNNFIALATSLPDDPEVKAIVLKTRRRVNELNRQVLKQESKSLKGESTGHMGINTLSGWKKCRQCHPRQTAFWQQTQHAQAFQTLVAEEQQFKPDCIRCHVTLPSYKTGSFSDNSLRMIRMKPQLQNVGCETCHGPGKKHSAQPETTPLRLPSRSLCLSCHTEEHDDNFQFEEDIKKIGCPEDGPEDSDKTK